MIAGGDRLSLPTGVTLGPDGIVDPVRAAVLPLNESARFVLARLDGRSFADLVALFARRFRLAPEAAGADLRLFCGDLNAKLLLNIAPRRGAAALVVRWLTLSVYTLPLGSLPGMAKRRRPIHSATAARAAVSVVRGLAAQTAVLFLLAAGVAALVFGGLGAPGLGVPVALGAYVAAGLAVHEAGHAALLRRVPCCLATSGLHAFVVHPPLTPAREAQVAAAGPAAPLLTAFVSIALARVLGLEELALGSTTLAAHGPGLTVAARDGRVACGLS